MKCFRVCGTVQKPFFLFSVKFVVLLKAREEESPRHNDYFLPAPEKERIPTTHPPLQKSPRMVFHSKKVSFSKLRVFLKVHRTNNVFDASLEVEFWRPKNGHFGPKLSVSAQLQLDTFKLKITILVPNTHFQAFRKHLKLSERNFTRAKNNFWRFLKGGGRNM